MTCLRSGESTRRRFCYWRPTLTPALEDTSESCSLQSNGGCREWLRSASGRLVGGAVGRRNRAGYPRPRAGPPRIRPDRCRFSGAYRSEPAYLANFAEGQAPSEAIPLDVLRIDRRLAEGGFAPEAVLILLPMHATVVSAENDLYHGRRFCRRGQAVRRTPSESGPFRLSGGNRSGSFRRPFAGSLESRTRRGFEARW